MAQLLGADTILALALPTGVDADRIAKWTMQDGTTYQQFVQMLSLGLADLNQEFGNKWGYLFSITESPFMEYPDGSTTTALQMITDVDNVDAIHGTTIGHMIDLEVYGGAIGGSKRFFRDARMARIRSNVRTLVDRAKWRFELNLFTRLFTNTENAVGSGYDVPFVRGTGGNVDFTPPAFSGETFATSHDHFLGVDSDTKGYDDVLEELVETLVEHGHDAPFDVIVSKTDIDAGSYQALAKWADLVDIPQLSMIDKGGLTTGNHFFANGNPMLQGIVGYYKSRYGTVNVRTSARVPQYYAAGFKSYGLLDPRNPLAVRVHPEEGFGVRVVPETTSDVKYPIKKVNIEFEFGVGVGEDRTNGAVAFLDASGTWTNPTIS